MTYTRSMVTKYFVNFARELGKTLSYRDSQGKINVGAWVLDHNPTYGGYIIEEIDNIHGGVFHPFNNQRMKADSFILAMDAFLNLRHYLKK